MYVLNSDVYCYFVAAFMIFYCSTYPVTERDLVLCLRKLAEKAIMIPEVTCTVLTYKAARSRKESANRCIGIMKKCKYTQLLLNCYIIYKVHLVS